LRISHENGATPDKLVYMANQIGKFWISREQGYGGGRDCIAFEEILRSAHACAHRRAFA
jgi:hypothetical protein